jgi:lambda repressor-like predicted transcriptional regulator
LIIGGLVSTLVIGVAALGIAAYSLLPTLAYAQQGPRSMPRLSEGPMPFEGRGHVGPVEQFGNFDRGGPGWFGGKIDRQALLADALGITVEELQAAQEKADLAAIQQAVDEGLVTQEQADLMTAGYKLRSYIDREALMAQALGMSVQELQAARDEGKPLAVIIYEQGLNPATLRTNMQTAYDEAVQQAIADGVITQEQADQLANRMGAGFGPGGFHGRGGFGGPRGEFGGFGPW